MDLSIAFTKRNLLVIVSVVAGILLVVLYVNWPSILSQLSPQERLEVVDVTYPLNAYRAQNLPILISLVNKGEVGKNVLVEVLSTDSPTISNKTSLTASGSVADVLINLPISTIGTKSFKVNVYWVGPGELCKVYQTSIDKTFTALAAEYDVVPNSNIASIAEHFDWNLAVTNIGNTPANHLVIRVADEGPLIISTPDSQTLDDLHVGETRQVGFRFSVPHDTPEGKRTILLDFTTYYPDCKETCSQAFTITLQKSPLQVDVGNATSTLVVLGTLATAVVAFGAIFGKKRR
jgi:hypothetical protein